MKKSIRETLLTGLGLASLTKARVEKIIMDAAKKSGISQKEADKFAQEFMKKMKNSKEEAGRKYGKGMTGVFKQLGVPSAAEVAALKKRVDKLEREMNKKKKPQS